MEELLKNFYITNIGGLFEIYSPLNVRRDIVNRKYSGLLICSTGQIEYHHNNNVFVCDKNHILFVPSGITYYLECTKEDVSYVINFQCTISEETFVSLSANVQKIVEKIKVFMSEHRPSEDDYNLSLTALILEILGDFARKKQKKTPQILDDALWFIHQNYCDPKLSNSMIAEHCSSSVIYLQKLFSKYCKVGIKEYITNLRFNKAEQLLLSTNTPIYEIATECGFNNQISFFRAFSNRHNGLTPLKYRNSSEIM